MYRTFFLLIMSGLISATAAGQTGVEYKKLDSLVSILANANKFMGSLTISRNDSILYTRASGKYKIVGAQGDLNTNEETRFRIGSVSKIFTAVLIFQLIEEGKLKLSSYLSDFYPQLPNANKITIKYLLDQHSGLYNFPADSSFGQWFDKPRTEAQMLSIVEHEKPDFQPGDKAEYSNTNYLLLGYIVEKITKDTYKDELISRITGKLGLKNTFYGAKINVEENEAQSYDLVNGAWVAGKETNLSVASGAGAIVSTSKDLARFITALFDYKLVNKQSLKEMKSLQDEFGMGLSKLSFHDYSLYGDIGIIDHFYAGVCYFTKEGIAVSFTNNGLNMPVNEFFTAVLNILFGEPYTIPAYDLSLTKEEMAAYEGIYTCTMASMPLKITVKKGKYNLTAQVAGQEVFPLDIVTRMKFRYDAAGVVIEFSGSGADIDGFTLLQSGAAYTFKRYL